MFKILMANEGEWFYFFIHPEGWNGAKWMKFRMPQPLPKPTCCLTNPTLTRSQYSEKWFQNRGGHLRDDSACDVRLSSTILNRCDHAKRVASHFDLTPFFVPLRHSFPLKRKNPNSMAAGVTPHQDINSACTATPLYVRTKAKVCKLRFA